MKISSKYILSFFMLLVSPMVYSQSPENQTPGFKRWSDEVTNHGETKKKLKEVEAKLAASKETIQKKDGTISSLEQRLKTAESELANLRKKNQSAQCPPRSKNIENCANEQSIIADLRKKGAEVDRLAQENQELKEELARAKADKAKAANEAKSVAPVRTVVAAPVWNAIEGTNGQVDALKYYYIAEKDPVNKSGGYINEQGKYFISGNFWEAGDFGKNGLAAVCKCSQIEKIPGGSSCYNKRCGFINRNGTEVIPFDFYEVRDFDEQNLAAVNNTNGYWGYVNDKGQTVIPFKRYKYASKFSKIGFASFKNINDKCGYINIKGDEVIKPEYDSCSDFNDNGLAYVLKDKLYGVINKEGKMITPFKYNNVSSFSDMGSKVALAEFYYNEFGESGKSKSIFVNAKGDELLNIKAQSKLYSINNIIGDDQLYSVTNQQEKCGYINKQGDVVIGFNFNRCDNFENNINAVVRVSKNSNSYDGKYGLIDRKGNFILKPLYESIIYNKDYKLYVVTKNNYFPTALMNDDGKLLTDFKYKDITLPYKSSLTSLFPFSIKGNKKIDLWGYLNQEGKEVIPARYESAEPFSKVGLAEVCYKGKCGYINAEGQVSIELKFDQAHDFSTYGVAAVCNKNRCGAVNIKGDIVVPFEYNNLYKFSEAGYAAATKDGKYGVINAKGEIILPFIYDNIQEVYCGVAISVTKKDEGLSGDSVNLKGVKVSGRCVKRD